MRISDWSSDVCSSDLGTLRLRQQRGLALRHGIPDISPMASFARSPLTAVLGPTNTGKPYLAVERMCAHSSGMIGVPLSLLAREVSDPVVASQGTDQVALITAAEKILLATAS